MNRPLVIYLASPFSHPSKMIERHRANEITRIAARLHLKHPHAFILPITQSYNLKKYEPKLDGAFSSWKDRDLTFIDVSHEVWVVMMEGWKESIGVQAEIEHANKTGKVVRYINSETIRFVNKKNTKKVKDAETIESNYHNKFIDALNRTLS